MAWSSAATGDASAGSAAAASLLATSDIEPLVSEAPARDVAAPSSQAAPTHARRTQEANTGWHAAAQSEPSMLTWAQVPSRAGSVCPPGQAAREVALAFASIRRRSMSPREALQGLQTAGAGEERQHADAVAAAAQRDTAEDAHAEEVSQPSESSASDPALLEQSGSGQQSAALQGSAPDAVAGASVADVGDAAAAVRDNAAGALTEAAARDQYAAGAGLAHAEHPEALDSAAVGSKAVEAGDEERDEAQQHAAQRAAKAKGKARVQERRPPTKGSASGMEASFFSSHL